MSDTPSPRRSGTRSAAIALAIGATLAGLGGLGYKAVAETKVGQHTATLIKHGNWHAMHRRGGEPMTEAELNDKVTRMIAHAAIELDATDAQRDEITAIATEAVAKVHPLRQAMREDAAALHALLLAPTVDAAAIEALRTARVADLDAKSKIMTDAVGRIAAVLTPEQRVMASERMKDFRGFRKHRSEQH